MQLAGLRQASLVGARSLTAGARFSNLVKEQLADDAERRSAWDAFASDVPRPALEAMRTKARELLGDVVANDLLRRDEAMRVPVESADLATARLLRMGNDASHRSDREHADVTHCVS